jgi:hypothetical protein
LRAIGWVRNIAYVGEKSMQICSTKKLREGDYVEDLDVDERIILKDLKKWNWRE